MIIGQAPGTRVHATGIPWNDPSGDRLRRWLDVSKDVFYDASKVAIMPMGFCYPGKGKGGDLPPRPECAPLWHDKVFGHLKRLQLILLVGQYAQAYYLRDARKKTLAETVAAWQEYGPRFIPLPHPSPRNIRWLKTHAWFERQTIPAIRRKFHQALNIEVPQ